MRAAITLGFACIGVLFAAGAFAQTAAPIAPTALLDPIFQDHAVLQRDQPVRLWGEAPARTAIAINLDTIHVNARADASGHWRAILPAHPASGPLTLSVRAGDAAETLNDIAFGDVFLCSGQSNMQFRVSEIGVDATTEIAHAANPNIRLLQITRRASPTPRASFIEAPTWRVAGPDSVGDFSAACYFMGRELERTAHVPIGLIHSSWGGSIIEAWISAPAFQRLGGYDEQVAMLAQYPNDRPGAEARFDQWARTWWGDHEPGYRQNWWASDLDDSSWPQMPEGAWEDSGDPALVDFDGSVWLRKEITLTAAQAAQHAELSLGLVDDYDNTFVNGIRLGGYRDKSRSRHYDISAGVLHAGRNVIAVGVIDTGTSGGLILGGDARAIKFADGSSTPIAGPWRYRISTPLSVLGRGPLAPWSGGLVGNYNGMIAPLGAYTVRAVVWYQGESNIDNGDAYARLLPALMADWRAQFENPALPFLIVQLPNYGPYAAEPAPSPWANLRETQRRAVLADPHASLIATIDIGDRYNVHPAGKRELGRRIALAVRRDLYHENVIASGPTPTAPQRVGAAIEIRFAHADPGLVISGAGAPLGFQLCDAQRQCRYADAAASGAAVRLTPQPQDRFVRYCWADSPICNLFNAAGLPAVPFEEALPLSVFD